MLNDVLEKLKPSLSYNTCGNRNENNSTHSFGRSSNTSKISCSVNEQMFSCKIIEGADKSKNYLSSQMTSSSDLSYTNNQINKAVEMSGLINTTDETVNPQNFANTATEQISNNHPTFCEKQDRSLKKQDRSLMNSKVDEKCHNVLKSVGKQVWVIIRRI